MRTLLLASLLALSTQASAVCEIHPTNAIVFAGQPAAVTVTCQQRIRTARFTINTWPHTSQSNGGITSSTTSVYTTGNISVSMRPGESTEHKIHPNVTTIADRYNIHFRGTRADGSWVFARGVLEVLPLQ